MGSPRVARLGECLPVRRFPEPDPPARFRDDDGVEPPPDHDLAARRDREGHQVTRSHTRVSGLAGAVQERERPGNVPLA
jgi:hypothetical protein